MKRGDLEKTEKEVIASREHAALKVGRRRSTLKPDVPLVRSFGRSSEHMFRAYAVNIYCKPGTQTLVWRTAVVFDEAANKDGGIAFIGGVCGRTQLCSGSKDELACPDSHPADLISTL